MSPPEERRRFLRCCFKAGLGSTLLPGVLLAQLQQAGAQRVTIEMLRGALALAGLSFTGEEQKRIIAILNQHLDTYEGLRKVTIPDDVAPPFYFNPLVPGMKVNRKPEPLCFSAAKARRPAQIEEAAFWPLTHLARLIRTRQVSSVELTRLYLDRLHRHNAKLNCVVTFLDDLAMSQAKQADADIAAGRYRSILHGIPWGAKDIIAVKGHPTTWGSSAYKDQVFNEDASVVTMLHEAGAVLAGKLATGELALGDRWFGGQTMNPWNTSEGSSGSSAGPAAATAAGLIGFSLGSDTGGSILSPAGRCGVAGLRPTFGRLSRQGVMTLSWTLDRLGPICRYVEDCAAVMSVIARPDGLDLSVADVPFHWNVRLDVRKLRVGYLDEAFAETRDPAARANEQATLDSIRSLGVKLTPLRVPERIAGTPFNPVECAALFDGLIRSGRGKELTDPRRADDFRAPRLIPAVEYLQFQRVRSMMMRQLAEATAGVDVYLAPAEERPPTASAPTPRDSPRPSVRQNHFGIANIAGYPALAVPNGFADTGEPTSVTFYARPFGEAALLALARAYEQMAGFHRRRPDFGR